MHVASAVPAKPAHRLSRSETQPKGNPLQLIVGLGAFITCFASFGTVAAMMPAITERLKLTEAQVGLVLAMPIFVGSVARIPMGILADRRGGRAVLLGLMAFSLLPITLIPTAREVVSLLVYAGMLGIPLSVFSVGVAHVSAWYPHEKQGTALGLLGFGYIGQALALFGAPVAAGVLGYAWGFWSYGILLGCWLIVVAMIARDAPRLGPPKRVSDYVQPLGHSMSWVLSLFYFLTFGGLLAMAAYLPKFLTLSFHLTRSDAGLRAAGFVALATAMRPIGGYLSDRIGARRILITIFPIVSAMAILMSVGRMVPFTIGALTMAVSIGLGNGAVFALVGECFRGRVGTVSGLVGAAGALGGFFPPILLGLVRQQTGSFTFGFILLSLFAFGCCLVSILDLRPNTEANSGTETTIFPPP